ncbi:uncharacterized protein Dmoj_GI26634 [Drosophila mojavensis]|uniref:Uncharacterized protein n=1 Tax=Drosophila mojavensis TaxID=7230 RepID=A0A0Q9X978_DROMO|nr:uncharacterized protein Dmoj_GI26634 [Drosophila mojavensis]
MIVHNIIKIFNHGINQVQLHALQKQAKIKQLNRKTANYVEHPHTHHASRALPSRTQLYRLDWPHKDIFN